MAFFICVRALYNSPITTQNIEKESESAVFEGETNLHINKST
jgi:hypothetical protein